MIEHNDFRYQKLIWSMVIVLALFLYVIRMVNQTNSILGGFGFFIAGGALFSLLGLFFFVLRLFRFLIKRYSFIYILTATALLGIGGYGIFIIFSATVRITLFELLAFLTPIILGICMAVDIFVCEGPYIGSFSKKEHS